ncbi:MAG: TonB-dependent receptor [Kofleriaceae bacterium]
MIGVALAAVDARAQSSTTGAIQGRVLDAETGEPLGGTTVIAVGAVPQPQTTYVAEDGTYKLTDLLPGEYTVTFVFGDSTAIRKRIRVNANTTVSLSQSLKLGGFTVEVVGPPPQIDPTNVEREFKMDRKAIISIPTPTRGFDGAAATIPGAHNDGVGMAISSGTALENRYFVDGVDITGLTLGTIGTPVLNEFIEEIEVIAGGSSAEWGRAVGGIVNVVTKTGSNQLRGSVFGTISPGFLAKAAASTPSNATSIDVEANRVYSADFGFDLGGPIIKDHLWFYLGFAPQLGRTDYTRITKRQTDCRKRLASGEMSACDGRLIGAGGNGDGAPDVDPATGFFITDELDRDVREGVSRSYTALGKLNLAITPKQQAQLSLIAVPSSSRTPGLFGLPSSGTQANGLTTDLAARWTAKLADDRTELEALVAWHRSTANTGSIDPALDDDPLQILNEGNLGTWSALGGESAKTAKGCSDGVPGDPYFITNCPMVNVPYAIGGPGAIRRDLEDRKMARLTLTQRGRLAGSHELKLGLDVENDRKTDSRLYSGGALIQNAVGREVLVTRWVQLAGADDPAIDPRFDQTCHTPNPSADIGQPSTLTFACDFLPGKPGEPGTLIEGQTISWAAFVRDSWQIQPNLTFNAGVRYEEQRMRYAADLRHTRDALTGNTLGVNAMTLTGNVAPRLGLIWDPTKIGAAKVYGSWGRFFEAIPMQINDRSFGGEVSYQQRFQLANAATCGPSDPRLGGADGVNCLGAAPDREELIGSSGVLVAPGIKAQYMDELLVGAEYMLPHDLKIGVLYQNRQLGRVIEDVSTDGARTYILANPGEWSDSEQHALETQIAQTTEPAVRRRLENQLALFKGIRLFDRPTRRYDAVELQLSRRLLGGLYVQASYTWSRTHGNFPGSVSYDNGQLDPNISSQYDLIELLANRNGLLPQDRPHSFKLDSHYTFELGTSNLLTLGTRARLVSGIPENALGAHYLYGSNESFLLPRGQLGRTGIEHSVDVHISYGRRLSKTVTAELFADVFNVYDNQGTFEIDRTYAPAIRRVSAMSSSGSANNVNPISGGTYEDLVWAKTIDVVGNETSVPTARNPNFRKPVSRYAPVSARLGFRLTF